MKLAFVILNYNTYKECIECVNSIFNHVGIEPSEYNITIVDNRSPDSSYEQLVKKYNDDKNIDILQTPKNLGFARGNNFGIKHVNLKYSPDYIAVINSDTELVQDNFYQAIKFEDNMHDFGVLGPMEALLDGTYIGPWEPMSREKLMLLIKHHKREQLYLKYHIEKITDFFAKVKRNYKKLVNKEYRIRIDQNHNTKSPLIYHENVELHGAFLIFNKNVFDKIEGFDDRTFLYYEEQLLYLMLKKNKLKSVYTPNIVILHKEGRATKNSKGTSYAKRIFTNKCNLESESILLSELDKMTEIKRN